MPVETIAESDILVPPGYPKRKRWTRVECEALESTGIWNAEKLELIEGDLIDRRSKNRPHVNTMMLVMEWLIGVFGIRYITPEAPVDVAPEDNPTNEPQPDLTVLAQPRSAYGSENPKPGDIRLLVEVSDTTLAFDLGLKARIYARAGICEYWVVDIVGKRIYVHRSPQGGVYRDIASYGADESVKPLCAPGTTFAVKDAFTPPSLPHQS
jgi:Uma2 family endonuclease